MTSKVSGMFLENFFRIVAGRLGEKVRRFMHCHCGNVGMCLYCPVFLMVRSTSSSFKIFDLKIKMSFIITVERKDYRLPMSMKHAKGEDRCLFFDQ